MLMVFGALVALPHQPAGAAETTVVLKDVKFNPAGVTIATGDTVVWKNEDTASHSVTFDDGSFDSHPQCVQGLLGPVNCMDPGETVQHTFDKPGQHKYKCKLHAAMTGNVLVKEAAAVTTATTTPTTQAPTTVTTIATTTTTRPLATSSTRPSTTTSTVPEETTSTLTPNESPAFDPGDGDGDDESGAPASSDGGGGGGSGTVALIVAVLLAVAGGGGVLLWRLRPRGEQP